MEMMTQLPVMKTQAAPTQKKTKQDDAEATEAVSFPTLLQETSNSLKAEKSETSTAATLTTKAQLATEAQPATVAQPAALLVDAVSCSPCINIMSENLSPLLSGVPVETADTPVATDGLQVAAVIEGAATVATEIPETQIEAVIQEAIISLKVEGKIPETSVEVVKTEATTAVAVELGTDKVVPQPQATEPIISTEVPDPKQNLVKSAIPVPVTGEQPVSIEGKATSGSTEIPTALVDDEVVPSKIIAPQKPVEKQDTAPITEKMNFEVVKETPDAEQPIAPAVENPALARQSSAELDMLAAQANAQKNYQQPVAAADQGSIPKPTLADLDLDSGSFESNEQKDQSISRILSSINSTTSSVKRSIRGQVLSGVVDHLQEEIGKEKLTIRLNPEKLGQIEILFQAEGDKLSITMSSNGKDAEQAIQEGTRELAEKITENSARYNLVDIKVENRGQDQQSKQDARQEEKQEKSKQGQDQQQQEGQRHTADHNQDTGIGEWAAFHLGG